MIRRWPTCPGPATHARSSTPSAPGERSPVEELGATLAAISSSDLNAFSFVDDERALDAARAADVRRPFGGVPAGIKELESVEGWPAHRSIAGVPRPRRRHDVTSSSNGSSTWAAPSPVGLTTASEFGGLNVSVTKLNGVTHNPWKHGRTTGGSSGGTRGGRRGRSGHTRDRRRRRRFDPHPGRLHRPARHEGHVRPHPAWAARVLAPEHRRAREPGPFRTRRGAPTTTCARATTPTIRRACPRREDGRPGSVRMTSPDSGSAVLPSLGGVTSSAGVEDRIRARGRGALIARHGHGRSRPATSSSRTWLRNG